MRVETQDLGDSSFLFLYEADPEVVEEKLETAIDQFKDVDIPGFRKGKATPNAIRVHKKKEIDQLVKQELAVQAYDEILYDTGMKVIGSPHFTEVKLTGKKFSCKMAVVKRPEFELVDLKKLVIPPLEIPEQDLENTLDVLCHRHGSLNPFGEKDVVGEGDKLTLDISYTIDEEETVLDSQPYDVGSQGYPGLDDEIIGMKINEEKKYTFNNGGKDYAFKVKVKMGLKNVPADLDDELAKKYKLENFEQLIGEVEKSQTAYNNKKQAMYQRTETAQWLVNHHEFEVPASLILEETKVFAARNGLEIASLGEEEMKTVASEACNSVKLALVLEAVREDHPESFLSDQEAIQGLAGRAKEMGQDPQKTITLLQQRGFLASSLQSVKDEYTLHWITTFTNNEVRNVQVPRELPPEVVQETK